MSKTERVYDFRLGEYKKIPCRHAPLRQKIRSAPIGHGYFVNTVKCEDCGAVRPWRN